MNFSLLWESWPLFHLIPSLLVSAGVRLLPSGAELCFLLAPWPLLLACNEGLSRAGHVRLWRPPQPPW